MLELWTTIGYLRRLDLVMLQQVEEELIEVLSSQLAGPPVSPASSSFKPLRQKCYSILTQLQI